MRQLLAKFLLALCSFQVRCKYCYDILSEGHFRTCFAVCKKCAALHKLPPYPTYKSKLKEQVKTLTILLFTTWCALACIELFLAWKQWRLIEFKNKLFGITESREVAAKKVGAKLSLSGGWYMWFPKLLTEDFAVGTYPNTLTIGFNEGKGYPTHMTDRYGFFNQDSWWNEPIDLIICGDSFASCEHIDFKDSLVAIMRKRGIRAVTLGVTGSGPYIQLAALKSIFPNPTVPVLWLYYEGNDLMDAGDESKQPILRNIVNKFTHQPNWHHLDNFNTAELFDWKYKLSSFITLRRLRYAINAIFGHNSRVKAYNVAIAEAARIAPRALLVRIPRNNGYPPHDKSWNKINFPLKASPTFYRHDYSMSQDGTHLVRSGHEKLTQLAIDFLKANE